MISFFKRKRNDPTFILAILGNFGRVESDLARSLERLELIALATDCQIVIALEDQRWETIPLVQTLCMRFPKSRLQILCGNCADRPAQLYSAAAERADGEFLQFLWPGCLPDLDAVNAACDAAESEDLDWLGCVGPLTEQFAELCAPELGDRFYSHYLACGRWIPLCQAVIRRTSFLAMKGFRQTPLLQRDFDADYWLRSVRRGQKAAIRAGALAEARWTWEDFPLQEDLRVPRYLSHSFRVRTAGCPDDADERRLLGKFAADLPPTLRRTVERLAGVLPAAIRGRDRPPFPEPCRTRRTGRSEPVVGASSYKIAVTGGPWEYAHNRLCFYNHFAHLEGQGLFTYIPLLDHLLVPQRDLLAVDAVIISRGRHANIRNVLDYCRRQSIATLYMIDDNWIWVGKDWPQEYAATFAPGLPQYEMFLSSLRECDAVLVYNDLLREDVQAHAKRVIRLPTNVRSADFQAPMTHPELQPKIAALLAWRKKSGGLVAGYIGSLRYSDKAFQALAAASQRTSRPVKVVLFGSLSDRQLQLFGKRAIVLPFVGYDAYAAALGALKPDILIAPLDHSRTSMSKCPNKYLEYSVCGAAAVYSNIPPYSQTIVDTKTGLLVREDDVASWAAAIERLINDDALRQSIASAARRDVQEKYETAAVAPAFAEALRGVIEGRRPAPSSMVQEPAAC